MFFRVIFKIGDTMKKLKKLNTLSAILHFIYAAFFAVLTIFSSIYLFSVDGWFKMFLFIFLIFLGITIMYLYLGIENLKANKSENYDEIKSFYTTELIVNVSTFLWSFPGIIISAFKLVQINKIKKTLN